MPDDRTCPFCYSELTGPMHTDKEIRELGIALEWPDLAVCEACYHVLRTYREIVRKDVDTPTSAISI